MVAVVVVVTLALVAVAFAVVVAFLETRCDEHLDSPGPPFYALTSRGLDREDSIVDEPMRRPFAPFDLLSSDWPTWSLDSLPRLFIPVPFLLPGSL